jgi:hypothetical protein
MIVAECDSAWKTSLSVLEPIVRTPAEQRDALAVTIRDSAEWRRRKADEFEDEPVSRKASLRARQALRTLANFVEALPDDDPELGLYALRRVELVEGRLALTSEAKLLLSRFGIAKRSWQSSTPSERQMRKILRQLDGMEAHERGSRKLGYGEG